LLRPEQGKDVLLQTFDLIAPGALETFVRESRLCIGLSHLNLLESVDAWIDGEVACAVFAVDFDETIADVMDHGPR